jgi:hypothetical protein
MELETAWNNYKELNALFSANSRQLAFAIGTLCWFFRTEVKISGCTDINFPPFIVTALLFIVLFFLSDLSQYLYQTVVLRKHLKSEERRILKITNELTANTIIQNPDSLYKPAIVLLCFKTTALYIAGFLLLSHFIKIIAQ